MAISKKNDMNLSKFSHATKTTDEEQKAQMREWSTETDTMEFHIPAIPNGNRNLMVKNSQEHSSPSGLALPLPTLDLPEPEFFFRKQGGE